MLPIPQFLGNTANHVAFDNLTFSLSRERDTTVDLSSTRLELLWLHSMNSASIHRSSLAPAVGFGALLGARAAGRNFATRVILHRIV
jgi:hypothetical protein